MTLAAVQGQPRAVDALSAALRSGAIHHAWLFAGPEGVGKELTAIAFAQALMCPERPGEGCGDCATCGRVARRNHPDVVWLMPEDEQVSRGIAGRSDFTGTPSREIKVEQIRGLQERLSFRALEGERKIAIVASAHKMNTAAQNAFLKTLEEPPSGTVLILSASTPDELLPTIRSRCSRVHFGPLPESFVAERLRNERKLDEETARLVAVMAGGSMSRALELDVKSLAQRKEIVSAFEALDFSDARTLIAFADAHGGDRADAEDVLRILSLWTRDLAVARVDAGALVNRDLAELAQNAAEKLSDGEVHRRHRLIELAQYAISSRNGSARLQLERMLIEMARTAGAEAA
ncbi:MAG: DNA polymerase III subunit delta' [Myxococcaceae bacterium]